MFIPDGLAVEQHPLAGVGDAVDLVLQVALAEKSSSPAADKNACQASLSSYNA